MNIYQKSVIVFGAAYYEYANWKPYGGECRYSYSQDGFLNTYLGAFAGKCLVDAASFITLGHQPLLDRIVELAPSLLTENNKLLFFIQKLFTSTQAMAYLSFTSYIALNLILVLLPKEFESGQKKEEQERALRVSRVLNTVLGVIFHSFLIFDLAYLSLGVFVSPFIILILFHVLFSELGPKAIEAFGNSIFTEEENANEQVEMQRINPPQVQQPNTVPNNSLGSEYETWKANNPWITTFFNKPISKQDWIGVDFGGKILNMKVNKSPLDNAMIAVLELRSQNAQFKSATDPFCEEMIDKLAYETASTFVGKGDTGICREKLKAFLNRKLSKRNLVNLLMQLESCRIKNNPTLKPINADEAQQDIHTQNLIEASEENRKVKSALSYFGAKLFDDELPKKIYSFINEVPKAIEDQSANLSSDDVIPLQTSSGKKTTINKKTCHNIFPTVEQAIAHLMKKGTKVDLIDFGTVIYQAKIKNFQSVSPMDETVAAVISARSENNEFSLAIKPFIEESICEQINIFIGKGPNQIAKESITRFLSNKRTKEELLNFGEKIYKARLENVVASKPKGKKGFSEKLKQKSQEFYNRGLIFGLNKRSNSSMLRQLTNRIFGVDSRLCEMIYSFINHEA